MKRIHIINSLLLNILWFRRHRWNYERCRLFRQVCYRSVVCPSVTFIQPSKPEADVHLAGTLDPLVSIDILVGSGPCLPSESIIILLLVKLIFRNVSLIAKQNATIGLQCVAHVTGIGYAYRS